RYSIRFGLTGDSRTFAYARKSGESATVSAALAVASNQPVTIMVDSDESQPFLQVYEVSSNHGALRSYAQVQHSWASDYRFGYLAALLAFAAAGALEYGARRCAA